MQTILIIDDDSEFRELASEVLMEGGYDVWDVPCPEEALPVLMAEEFDLILCDLHMPYSVGEKASEYIYSYEVGVRTIQELTGVYPDIPVIGLSSAAPSDLRRIAKYLEPAIACSKPCRPSELLGLVEDILTHSAADFVGAIV